MVVYQGETNLDFFEAWTLFCHTRGAHRYEKHLLAVLSDVYSDSQKETAMSRCLSLTTLLDMIYEIIHVSNG